MNDLPTRLLAAIEETERDAKGSMPGPWWVVETWGSPRWAVVSRSDPKNVAQFGDYGSGQRMAYHVARHNPEAVLRRCAADRKIVGLCKDMLWEHEGGPDVVAKGTLLLLAEGYGITEETDRG